jgi:hypothetical protein
VAHADLPPALPTEDRGAVEEHDAPHLGLAAGELVEVPGVSTFVSIDAPDVVADSIVAMSAAASPA